MAYLKINVRIEALAHRLCEAKRLPFEDDYLSRKFKVHSTRSLFQSFPVLLLAICLTACSPESSPPKSLAEQEQPRIRSLTLAADSDAWGGDLITTGNRRIVAAALHRINELGVWEIDAERQAIPLGRNISTGYHPDGAAALGGDRVVVAVEGAREYAIWSLTGQQPREVARVRTPFASRDVVVGDFDQDGVEDMVFAPYIGDRLAVYWGTGAGFVAEPQFVNTGLSAWHPVVHDWNQDGIDDLLWAELETGMVRVALGAQDRGFAVNDLFTVKGVTARHLAVGDINGDGLPDLAIAVEVGDSKILLSKKTGEFDVISVPPGEGHLGFVSVAVLDAGVMAFADEQRVVLMHHQDVTGERRYLPAGSLPTPMIVRDVDGDDIDDLLIFNSAGGGITVNFGPLWENAESDQVRN